MTITTLPTLDKHFDLVIDPIIEANILNQDQKELFAGQLVLDLLGNVLPEWVEMNDHYTEVAAEIEDYFTQFFGKFLAHTADAPDTDFEAVAAARNAAGFNAFFDRLNFHTDHIYAAVNFVHTLIGETNEIINDTMVEFVTEFLPGYQFADESGIEGFDAKQAEMDQLCIAAGNTIAA